MKQVFDTYCKQYDVWYDKNKFAYLSTLKVIKKVLPKVGIGLEIGVGTGRYAAPLGIKYGIDPSKRMLAIAKKRGVCVRLGYAEALPFKDLTLDYVAIITTLCFVKDPVRVLVEARRVLKKEGKIIIAFVDKKSFLGKLYQRKKSVFYKQAHFFSPEEVEHMLKKSGFHKLSFYQVLFRPPERVYSIEKEQKGFGKGGFVVVKGGLK
ncbi:MAG: class I SAM-dependent methyltransferase [Candidatus Omnitrophota bacterium]|jgi:ubiquinone/menaquinone biosynthesis C-methylase UbiE|nr:MAG: class I SAM-dependent methyltransferase [Candidatus Omnitrophota bacterium]